MFCNQPKAESEENGDEIECQDEVVSLMQDRYQENKLSNETGTDIIYIVFPSDTRVVYPLIGINKCIFKNHRILLSINCINIESLCVDFSIK